MDARQDDHHRDDERDERRRGGAVPRPAGERAGGDRGRVLAGGLGDAERGGHLLQEDQHRDAGREALHDRPRQDAGPPPEARDAGDHEQEPGQERDDRDGARADRRHDGHEHDGHRAGRSADLDVGAAERPGDDPGHDRGDDPRLGAEARGDAERERERQRDDGDGDARQQVAAPGARQVADVAAAGQQAGEPAGHARRSTSREAVSWSSSIWRESASSSPVRSSASA
jgi:hypothetical protein